MQLFDLDPLQNLLPQNGTVNYWDSVFTKNEADYFYNKLFSSIFWENDEVFIFGKHITTARKVAWYSENEATYTYSKITKKPHQFTPELLKIKQVVENITNQKFNSCLLNLYHNGKEGMSWHSDNEKELVKNGTIASVSFGAVRKFAFKHKQTQKTVSLYLAHGSLLVMKGQTQDYWLHKLPTSLKINEPRINLTFRQIL
jgi:alkylated DNA repair dioxygenase AlkB